MRPALPEGAWILIAPVVPGRLAAGQVVLARHPLRPELELVKRVEAISRRHRLVWLAGDNRMQSSDSESFGPVSFDQVTARVVLRLRPWPISWAGRPRAVGLRGTTRAGRGRP